MNRQSESAARRPEDAENRRARREGEDLAKTRRAKGESTAAKSSAGRHSSEKSTAAKSNAGKHSTGDAAVTKSAGTGKHSAGTAGAAKSRAGGKARPSGEGTRRSAAPGKKGAAHGKKAAGRKRSKSKGGTSALSRWVSAQKQTEAGAIAMRSAGAALILMAALAVLALMWPTLRVNHARGLVRSGRLEAAADAIEALVRDEVKPSQTADLRAALADAMIQAGDYDGALAQAALLEGDARAEALTQRARYGQADRLYAAGDYSGAGQMFYQFGGYGDSAGRYLDCRCALAIQAHMAGDDQTAEQILSTVADAETHLRAAALSVGGGEAEAATILSAALFTPEGLAQLSQRMAALNAAREQHATGRVAVGNAHTVAVGWGGVALFAGDNSRGQGEVNGWSDIVQVAAGAEHTVGLRLDGTVVAAGANDYGQCDVGEWTQITAIACTAYGTLGLRSDGTVAATRACADAVSGWHDVKAIAGGAYAMACITGEGGMVASHPGARMQATAVLDALDVNGPVSAGITTAGALVSSYEKAPEWTDLASVDVSSTGILAVTRDGKAKLFDFRRDAEAALPVDGFVVEAHSSGTHYVALTRDGRVYAFGDNAQGQCDVSEWKLSGQEDG